MSDQKKILLATGIFPPDIGGPATYALTLLEELPKFGFEVKVVTYSDDHKKLQITNPKLQINSKLQTPNSKQNIIRISRKQNLFFRYIKYFIKSWKLAGWADVIYAQDAVNSGLPVWLACKLRGKKYYLKIVGDYAWEQGRQRFGVADLLDDFQNKKYGWQVEIWRKIEKFVVRKAKKIIVPSNYLKAIVRQWGIEEDKIEVIYNAVKKIDATEFDKTGIKQELNLSGDIIVSAGRLVPWKGFDTLIEIMPDLLKINPNFKLYIIGDGPEVTSYELQITSLNLKNNIILTGALEQDLLWKYLVAADMFVLNTGYEGLPHITIEAMQLGAPVITTRAGGNTEVVEDNKNGLLVEYNNQDQLKNAIIKLYKDKELAAQLAYNAKQSLREKFSKDRMIKSLLFVITA